MHGPGTYDYSAIEVITHSHDRVPILCRLHGLFHQQVHVHTGMGHGCPLCGRTTLSRVGFANRVHAIHGDKFDLTATHYRGQDYEVDVRCAHHGEFTTLARCLLTGDEPCPGCSVRGGYSIKVALDWLMPGILGPARRAPPSARQLTLYVAHQQAREPVPETSHRERFLNIGLARRGYQERYATTHPYATRGNPNRLVWPAALAVILEQVLLKETTQWHYVPRQTFAGGTRECRGFEACDRIEQLLQGYVTDPATLLDSPWVAHELQRHQKLHHLPDLKEQAQALMQRAKHATLRGPADEREDWD